MSRLLIITLILTYGIPVRYGLDRFSAMVADELETGPALFARWKEAGFNSVVLQGGGFDCDSNGNLLNQTRYPGRAESDWGWKQGLAGFLRLSFTSSALDCLSQNESALVQLKQRWHVLSSYYNDLVARVVLEPELSQCTPEQMQVIVAFVRKVATVLPTQLILILPAEVSDTRNYLPCKSLPKGTVIAVRALNGNHVDLLNAVDTLGSAGLLVAGFLETGARSNFLNPGTGGWQWMSHRLTSDSLEILYGSDTQNEMAKLNRLRKSQFITTYQKLKAIPHYHVVGTIVDPYPLTQRVLTKAQGRVSGPRLKNDAGGLRVEFPSIIRVEPVPKACLGIFTGGEISGVSFEKQHQLEVLGDKVVRVIPAHCDGRTSITLRSQPLASSIKGCFYVFSSDAEGFLSTCGTLERSDSVLAHALRVLGRTQ